MKQQTRRSERSRELDAAVVRAQGGDEDAMDSVLRQSRRLAIRYIEQKTLLAPECEDWLDLLQELLFIAARKAIPRYKPGGEAAFTTVMRHWFDHSLSRWRARSGPIRIADVAFGVMNSDDPKRRDIPSAVAAREARAKVFLSYDDPDYNLVAEDDSPSVMETVQRNERIRAVRDAIDALPENERFVMLGRLAGKPCRAIGEEMGRSHARAQQLEKKAKGRLSRMLAAYADE